MMPYDKNSTLAQNSVSTNENDLPELLAAIVESSEDAIVGTTLDGLITSWNSSAQEIFGYKASEIIGRHISILYAPAVEDDMTLLFEHVRQGLRVKHYETVRRRKDGTDVPVSLSISPIRNAARQIIGVAKIARDITDQKRAEEILRRTEKLSVTARLAASVAHEINNPLAALMNLLYLMDQEDMSETLRQYLKIGQSELQRISYLTAQTLGFYHETSNPKLVPVLDIINFSVEVLRHRIKIRRDHCGDSFR